MFEFNIEISGYDIKFYYKNGQYIVSTVYNEIKYKGNFENKYDKNLEKYISMFKDESVCTLYKSNGNYIIELSINASLFNMSKKIYLVPEETPLDLQNLKLQNITGKEIVENLLKIDNGKRYEEVEDDLFPISSINTNVKWDMTLPTLLNACDNYINRYQKNVNKNLDELIKEFYESYPFLKNIDFDNVLIAGGCISNLVIGLAMMRTDIDFFIYGLTEEEASKKVIKLVFTILNIDGVELKAYIKHRYNLSIVISYPKKYSVFKLQFIFRLYKTKSAILHGFDIGSSAIGFDGKEIYLTSLSKFSFENMMNIVDTTRRSTTYERRLVKYFKRGFGIILPKLSIYNSTQYCINMPYMKIFKRYMHSNIIFVKRLEIGVEYYKKFGDSKKNNKNNNDDYDDEEFEMGFRIDRLINIQKKILTFIDDRIKIDDIIKITWKTENPGTQLTSSFNPIIEEESLWYGKYYL